jgi:membrane protein YdbS with pleckstrin-like domain
MPNPAEVPGRSETVLFRTGLHPLSIASALGLAGFIGFVGTLIMRHNDLPRATEARIAIVCFMLGAATLAGPVRRLRRSTITVTPGHLRLELGTWRSRVTIIPLRDIRSVDVPRGSALARRLDYGTIHVAAGEDTYVIVHHVRAPHALRTALRPAGGRR